MNVSISLNASRLTQVGIGGVALVGGFQAASSIVRSAYRDDLLGDPTRVVEVDGKSIIYQTRTPQGGKLTNFTMGAGAAAAFTGGALVLGSGPAANGVKSMLRAGGGTALFALGMGAIAGATAMSAQYAGADFVPVR